MKKMSDIDQLKSEYITGKESLRKLAIKYGLTRTYVQRKSASEEWAKLRAEYRANVVKSVCQKASRTREEEILEVIETADLVERRVKEILSADNALEVLIGTGNPGRELESLSKAIANADDLRRIVRGIMSPRDADRSKLDWEKYRSERADKDAEAARDNTVHVVFEGMEDLSV